MADGGHVGDVPIAMPIMASFTSTPTAAPPAAILIVYVEEESVEGIRLLLAPPAIRISELSLQTRADPSGRAAAGGSRPPGPRCLFGRWRGRRQVGARELRRRVVSNGLRESDM